MNKINFAVIGVGVMGEIHSRIISELDKAELVAVVDCDQHRAQKIAHKYNIQYFTKVEELFEKIKPEAVCICVPTIAHFEVTKLCLIKHADVLLEKPIADNENEAKELINLANLRNRKFMIGHNERFNPAFIKVKEIIDNNTIGKIISIHTKRVDKYPPRIKDVNIVVDLAIHDIDLINFLLDDLPHTVVADKRKNHLKFREDSVEIFLKYPNASACIQANWITPIKIRNMVITATKGFLEMDFLTYKIKVYQSNFQKFLEDIKNQNSENVIEFQEPEIIDFEVAKEESLKLQINSFIDAINFNQSIDSNYALEALKIAKQC